MSQPRLVYDQLLISYYKEGISHRDMSYTLLHSYQLALNILGPDCSDLFFKHDGFAFL